MQIFTAQSRLRHAIRLLSWNRSVLRLAGIWPNEVNNVIFALAITYVSVQVILCTGAYFSCGETNCRMQITMEMNICLVVLFKFTAYRINSSTLGELLKETREDFSHVNYTSSRQLAEFLRYNRMGKFATKIAMFGTVFPAILYYLKPLAMQLVTGEFAVARNSSVLNKLPYRVNLPFDVTEPATYAIIYLYEAPMVSMIIAGFTGTDCLLVTLGLHICGQFAATARRIEETINNNRINRHSLGDCVERHQRLIRMAETLNSGFNAILFYEFLSVTATFCFVWYNVILSSRSGQYVTMITFALVQNASLLSLFGYCFIGECLIHESSRVSEAIFASNWHLLPHGYKKDILITILRAQKPVYLTACNLITFSCETFATIVKSSAVYVSFLQQVL